MDLAVIPTFVAIMTIVQESFCVRVCVRYIWPAVVDGARGQPEIALAIEIRQNIWHSMFATFANVACC